MATRVKNMQNGQERLFRLFPSVYIYLRWRGVMVRGPDVYRSQLNVQLRRVWGVHFARVNARLKLARMHSAQGRGLPTAAGRGGCSHTTRAHRDADSSYHGRFSYRSAARTSGRFGG